MCARRQEQISYHPTSKTLMFDTTTTPAFRPSNTARLFPHRVKKMQQPDSLKKQKVAKMIEDIAQYHLKKEEQARSQSVNRRFLDQTSKASSYLAYKKEQQLFKLQHTSHVTNLKNRVWQQRTSQPRNRSQNHYKSLSFERSPTRKNNSMSRVNLELTTSNKNVINFPRDKPEPKARHFYLKTSEGKRKKLTSTQYQNIIRSRINKSEGKDGNSDLFSSFNEYSQNQLIYTMNDMKGSSEKPSAHNSTFTNRRLKNIKYKSNAYLRAKEDEPLVECRPWTSTKSQYEN